MASSTQNMYTTTTDVKAILPPTLPGGITTATIESRIRDASAYIDSKLTPVYVTPFNDTTHGAAPTPEHIQTLAKEAAAAMLRRDAHQQDRRAVGSDEPLVPVWIDAELKALRDQRQDLADAQAGQRRAYFPEVDS